MSVKRILIGTGKAFLTSVKAGIGTFLTLHYVGAFVVCKGPSMEPTLKTGNILLTDHLSPRLGFVGVGDIVVAESPEKNYVCKRIIRTAGDSVNYKGKVISVPEDHVWLEGDNKDDSHDSRNYGAIPISSIRGRCYCKVWPEFSFQLFSRSPQADKLEILENEGL